MATYDPDECLDIDQGGCAGDTFPRLALSGSGLSYPRCDAHYELYEQRLQPVMADIRHRFPEHPPADFDEMAAGERWSEDY